MDIGTASAHQPLMGGPTVSNPATANLSHFRGVLDRRLHTANTTRSLAPSPSPALQEPSPFKQGSPLAPIQDGREQYKAAQIEIASHRPALKTGSAKMMKPRDALWNYAPGPDSSRTQAETRQRQGQEGSEPARLSPRPRPPHDSENIDDASLSRPDPLSEEPWPHFDLSYGSPVEPLAESLVSETLGKPLTTTLRNTEALHPSDLSARLSRQPTLGFTNP
jgi:hypothetical protein